MYVALFKNILSYAIYGKDSISNINELWEPITECWITIYIFFISGPLGSIPDISADIFNQGCRGNLRNDLGVIPGMYNDSGVESSEYLQQRYLDIPPKSESDSIPELEEVLSKLTPEDLEKRRRMFSVGRFSFDLGSDGYESPGSALMGHPGFKFMPYGVRTPDSLMSTGSREWTGSSGSYLDTEHRFYVTI